MADNDKEKERFDVAQKPLAEMTRSIDISDIKDKTVAMRFTFPDGEVQEHRVPYPLLEVVKLIQRREYEFAISPPPDGVQMQVPSLNAVTFQLIRFEDSTGRRWAEYRLDHSHIIELARAVPRRALRADPKPGDFVIEPSRRRDSDAIGWLVAHGDAPYNKDGTGELREVWDVIPLARGRGGKSLRWENAEFFALPESIAALVREPG